MNKKECPKKYRCCGNCSNYWQSGSGDGYYCGSFQSGKPWPAPSDKCKHWEFKK